MQRRLIFAAKPEILDRPYLKLLDSPGEATPD
jgi:hypothetical protein